MRVEVRAGGGALALDPISARLLTRGSSPAPLLAALPSDDAGFRDAARAARRDPPPRALVDALVARQRALGTGRAAEANAASLADGAVLVIAGQQPGLLGGPLLSLHKAAGAVALAERFRGAGVERVVPAFWVASEDHDWAEANRAVVQCRDGEHRALALAVEGGLRSVRDVPVPEEASAALLAELAACLPETDRAREAAALAARPAGADLGTWFATILLRLVGDGAGLVILEPHVLAPWTGGLLARLVSESEVVSRALARGADRLATIGVPPPLEPRIGHAPVFLRDEPGGRRLRVELDGDRVLLRGEPSALTRASLVDRIRAHPELASGDVVGRVLAQNSSLPVLAQVAGPGEIAYLSQARDAHEALLVRFPLVVPRPRATWVESRVARDLEAFGLTVADVLAGFPPPAHGPDEGGVAAEVDAIRERLLARSAEVPEEAESQTLRALAEQAAKAARRLVEVEERRRGVGRARFERARSSVLPRERPQERVLSPLSVVARHGVETLRRGLSALDPLASGHHILHLE